MRATPFTEEDLHHANGCGGQREIGRAGEWYFTYGTGPALQFENWYKGPNSSQLAQLPGFRQDRTLLSCDHGLLPHNAIKSHVRINAHRPRAQGRAQSFDCCVYYVHGAAIRLQCLPRRVRRVPGRARGARREPARAPRAGTGPAAPRALHRVVDRHLRLMACSSRAQLYHARNKRSNRTLFFELWALTPVSCFLLFAFAEILAVKSPDLIHFGLSLWVRAASGL